MCLYNRTVTKKDGKIETLSSCMGSGFLVSFQQPREIIEMGLVTWNEYSVCFCLLWYYLSFGIYVLSELIQTGLKGEVNSLMKGAMDDDKDKFITKLLVDE